MPADIVWGVKSNAYHRLTLAQKSNNCFDEGDREGTRMRANKLLLCTRGPISVARLHHLPLTCKFENPSTELIRSSFTRSREMLPLGDTYMRQYRPRVVVLCVDHSSLSDDAVVWTAENVVQPHDHVHIVTAISAAHSDRSYKFGMRAHASSQRCYTASKTGYMPINCMSSRQRKITHAYRFMHGACTIHTHVLLTCPFPLAYSRIRATRRCQILACRLLYMQLIHPVYKTRTCDPTVRCACRSAHSNGSHAPAADFSRLRRCSHAMEQGTYKAGE